MSYSTFSDAFQSSASRMAREREILRVAATLGGTDGSQAARMARSEILRWAEKRTVGKLPPTAGKHEEFQHLAGGRNCEAVRVVDDNGDIWAIRADDPDKSVAQRIWTTEAIVGHEPKQGALLSIRLLVSSPERELQIAPAVPGLAQQLESKCGLYHGSKQLKPTPWVVQTEEDADHLIDMLINPGRRISVLVLSVPESAADSTKPLIDPSPLARATLALAVVVILPARFTWVLTERFGKRLSVFDGAVRVYFPGFAEDSDPYGHDLFLAEDVMEDTMGVSSRLQQVAAKESARQLRLGRDVLPYVTVKRHSLEIARIRLEEKGASHEEQLSAAQTQIAALKDNLNEAKEEQEYYLNEYEIEKRRAQSAESQQKADSYRIQQLLHQIKELGESPDANISLPSSWSEFADWCDQNLADRVVLSPRARREVKSPQFKDVATAAHCLLWLANEYRDQRLNGGDGDLRIQIKSGIKNDRCGADVFRMDWQGKSSEVEWHIKNGGNTRDPSKCLRIYYFWNDASRQVVIARMPAHVRTDAT